MHVPKDLMDQKLDALRLTLPGLLVDATPDQGRAEFAKLTAELLRQWTPDDTDHVLMRMEEIRNAVGSERGRRRALCLKHLA